MTTRAPQLAAPSDEWLLERYRRDGDLTAREQLVTRLMPLARRVATRYSAPGQAEDLLQAACVGLTKAIERYDPARGVALRTYAQPTMTGEVQRHLRDRTWAVRVPRALQERVMAVTKARARLTSADGRAPTVQDIADDLGLPLEDVLEAMQAGTAYSATSLDAPVGTADDDLTLGATLGSEDPELARIEELVTLDALRHVLDEQELQVLHLRFVDDLIQTEIGERIGVSQMQVSRILRRALGKLRAAGSRQ